MVLSITVIGVGVITVGSIATWVLSHLLWHVVHAVGKAGVVWGWNAVRRWWAAQR